MAIRIENVRVPPPVILAIGLLVLAWGAHNLIQAGASRNWPSVQGTVVRSSVTSTSSRTSSSEYTPKVEYNYEVDGKEYRNNRISFAPKSTSSRSEAESIAGKYAPGKTLPVYYAPGDPKRSVLEREVSLRTYVVPAAGLVILLFGVAVYVRPSLIRSR